MEDCQPGSGTIKSFSSRNGYGFIENDNDGVDLHFHSEMLPEPWTVLGPKLVGTKVQYEIVTASDGRPQARRIQPREFPGLGDQVAGQVKSWSEQKGYGFLQVPGLEDDVIFVRNRLPESCRNLGNMNDSIFIFELAQGESGEAGKYQGTNLQLPDARDLRKNATEHPAGVINGMNNNIGVKRPLPAPQNTPRAQRFRANEKFTGQLKNYFEQKGIGFIVVPGFQDDVIFQGQDFPNLDQCKVGEVVTFTTRTNEKGNPQAINLVMGGQLNDMPGGGMGGGMGVGNGNINGGGINNKRLEEAKLIVERLNISELSELCVHSNMMLRMRINNF